MSKVPADDDITDDRRGLKQMFSRTCDIVTGLCESLKNARNYRLTILERLKNKPGIKPSPGQQVSAAGFPADLTAQPEGVEKGNGISPQKNTESGFLKD